MSNNYVLYAWQCSHFSAKIRGYLNYKKIDYREKTISLYDIAVLIPRKTGAAAMPALKADDGTWLADTPLMIEELEKRHPQRPIYATTPRQRILEFLVENWFDDGWPAVSLQTRWAYSENWETLLHDECAKALMPGFPKLLSRRVATKVFHGSMNRLMHSAGARPDGQGEQIESWALRILDLLEHYFDQYPYLFGGHPTSADFAILGSLAAHQNRDSWPKREWMAHRPRLVSWTERLHAGEGNYGPLLSDDGIAETLQPLIDLLLAEFPSLISQTVEAIKSRVDRDGLTTGDGLPRVEREVSYPMNGRAFKRRPFTYTIWRMQRIKDAYEQLSRQEQYSVDQLLATNHCADFLKGDLGPRLNRNGLGARLA